MVPLYRYAVQQIATLCFQKLLLFTFYGVKSNRDLLESDNENDFRLLQTLKLLIAYSGADSFLCKLMYVFSV